MAALPPHRPWRRSTISAPISEASFVLAEGDSKYRPCPLLKEMVAASYLGRKTRPGFYRY